MSVEDRLLPPMGGLGVMAACLAEKRQKRKVSFPNGLHRSDGSVSTTTRDYAMSHPGSAPCSVEYYRIIDRIARGEKP